MKKIYTSLATIGIVEQWAILWIVFITFHFVLAGNWWVWNFFSIFPPFFYGAVTIGSAIALFLRVRDQDPRKKLTLVLLALAIVLVIPTFRISDIFIPNLFRNEQGEKGDYSLLSLNTQFWEEDEDLLFEFLKKQEADIYHLQEVVRENGNYIFLDGLAEAFPDYEIYREGELVTMSRLNVRGYRSSPEGKFLRVDIEVESTLISMYNVHIPVQIFTSASYMPYLQEWRTEAFTILEAELEKNTHEKIISGDFNSTTSMGVMDYFFENFDDASRLEQIVYPGTWKLGFMRLWRIDYVFLSKNLHFGHLSQVDAHTLSDHDGLQVYFSSN